MPTYTEHLLSGSTKGMGISMTGTGTGSADTIHTTPAGASNHDCLVLSAVNTHTSSVTLTIEFGGTAATTLIPVELAADAGLQRVVDLEPLNDGAVVKGFASVADKVNIFGRVRRYNA
tara:strand:- start:4 stop:357 length:354 start_codon:yes stop_codon:yes gene_type:complete